jgi:hypothetical protein
MRRAGRPRNEGGVLEDVLRWMREVVAAALTDSLKDASRELLHRALRATLGTALAAALLGTGLVLLLMGGFEALRLLPLPDAAAYAIIGALALGGGIAGLRWVSGRTRS